MNQETAFQSTSASQAEVNPNKALWEKGDFTRIAETMRESAAELINELGITKDLNVLDLACGDGTTAVPAAKLGAHVVGVDIARNLVAAGTLRAQKEGLANLTFQEGDVMNLQGLQDQGFDLVVSMFGAMFAPRPLDTAREMVRVTRPGGRIVMGNWIPGDPTFVSQLLKISMAYMPPPPEGFISPMLWGVESQVVERFAAAGVPGENISFVRDTYTFRAPFAPEEFAHRFQHYYGPTMNAFDAAAKNGRERELLGELEALCRSHNQSGNDNTLSIPATYLRVTVQC